MNRVVCRILAILALSAVAARADTIEANPSNYSSLLSTLQPGDTLQLEGGDYTDGMNIRLHGTAENWIVIRGPESGTPARFRGFANRCCNTIEIRDASYLAIENLTIDGEGIDDIFAISANGTGTHDIRIEGCTIIGHGANQQTNGISTKGTTWNWVVRRNRIIGAGTGVYFGNSDGTKPFINGLIEYNLFDDARGYNMQIKHQNSRDSTIPGIPTTPQTTIIRHNVFIKGSMPNEDGARPNLLLGAYPTTGLGSDDTYEVYGNVFFHNYRESLFQAEGTVSIHDNIFVDCSGYALYLTYHKKGLRKAYVYNNTFYDVGGAIRFANAASEDHAVYGNLMFSDSGLSGNYTNAFGNVHDTIANAVNYVKNPSIVLGDMDFYPIAGRCEGDALPLDEFAAHRDFDRDFNGESKGGYTFRGAYAGDGTNPGWQIDKAIQGEVATSPPPPPPPPPGTDTTPPTGTVDLGATSTSSLLVDLDLSATDASGIARMRFSNDGTTWSPPEPYAATKQDWDLSSYGGSAGAGTKVVYVQFEDAAGIWSALLITDSIEYQLQGGTPGPAPAPLGGGAADWTLLLALVAGWLGLNRRSGR